MVVGDNLSISNKLARLYGMILIACVSHMLSFAVNDYLKEFTGDPKAMKTILIKLRTLTHATKLRYAHLSILIHFVQPNHYSLLLYLCHKR